MPLLDDSQTDDPVLRAALLRVFSQERAPASLKWRIQAAMVAAGAASASKSASRRRLMERLSETWAERGNLRWLAAAAVLLVGLGAVTFSVVRTFAPPRRSPVPPNPTMLAMVHTHDYCCEAHAADHHKISAPREDFAAISRELSHRLNHPVFVADLTADGWQFHGAAICPVGGRETAHLMYVRQGQTLSLFSLPEPRTDDCGKLRRGDCLREEIQRHPVLLAGCRTGLVGLVGRADSGRLTVAELDDLFHRHQNDLVQAAPEPSGSRTFASSR